jgi:hypothetical protein
MIRYATMLVLFVCALGAWAHDPAAHQHAGAAADMIDGSKNPELIPDSLAFRLYFIALSENDSTLTESTERQKAFFATAGLKAADTEVAASILRVFKKRLDAMTDAYNMAVASTNDSTSGRTFFASKREDLVQATRNEFSIMLSADGAEHINGYVHGEKGKMKASKSEIQQIATLRSNPTGFQLVSMRSLQGGGCSGFMDPHYNSYTSYAINSQGQNLYASTQVDGYTGEGNGSWCYGSITHQPRLLLQLGTVGGWSYGQSVIPSSQIDYFQNVVLDCGLCGTPNSFNAEDMIYCSSLGTGFYYDIPIPPPVTLRIARTTYKYASILGGVCTYTANCINSPQTCGLDTITVQGPCAPPYFIAPFIVVRIGINSSCFPVTGVLSYTWLACY